MSELILYRIAFYILLGAIIGLVVSLTTNKYPLWVTFAVFIAVDVVTVTIIHFLFAWIGGKL